MESFVVGWNALVGNALENAHAEADWLNSDVANSAAAE